MTAKLRRYRKHGNEAASLDIALCDGCAYVWEDSKPYGLEESSNLTTNSLCYIHETQKDKGLQNTLNRLYDLAEIVLAQDDRLVIEVQ